MKPLQVTNKPRCVARVPNQWFHNQEFGVGPDHQCPFPIWREGRCKRHHPASLLVVLERREEVLAEKLAKVRADLEWARRFPSLIPTVAMENPS